MNTQIALYPPGGGGALGVTINDTMVQPLTTSGYYRVVITDSGLNDTGTYRLTLTGSGAQSGLPVAGSELPNGVRVALAPASPSPFHSSTRLSFRLRHDVSVTLRIFDARGALVRTLLDAMLPSGSHEAVWDGTDDRGRAAGSGVYHLQLRADGDEIRRKVVRVR